MNGEILACYGSVSRLSHDRRLGGEEDARFGRLAYTRTYAPTTHRQVSRAGHGAVAICIGIALRRSLLVRNRRTGLRGQSSDRKAGRRASANGRTAAHRLARPRRALRRFPHARGTGGPTRGDCDRRPLAHTPYAPDDSSVECPRDARLVPVATATPWRSSMGRRGADICPELGPLQAPLTFTDRNCRLGDCGRRRLLGAPSVEGAGSASRVFISQTEAASRRSRARLACSRHDGEAHDQT